MSTFMSRKYSFINFNFSFLFISILYFLNIFFFNLIILTMLILICVFSIFIFQKVSPTLLITYLKIIKEIWCRILLYLISMRRPFLFKLLFNFIFTLNFVLYLCTISFYLIFEISLKFIHLFHWVYKLNYITW
jgi:hypothetical protein